ncbi:PREDICTED: olfactory receptor 8D1-like [Condylura cristata]|uniref:olfactory receptor 8D1-like n=1 Tax=Condylura cristata TaxID=143302 RepID=UPI0006429B9F|nr:PREDICTED: olfactory receptor 8D1-like [Condylura cristata]
MATSQNRMRFACQGSCLPPIAMENLGVVILTGIRHNLVCLGTYKKMEANVVKVKTCSGSEGASNTSKWSGFFLMGLTDDPQLQPILFVLFFFVYAFTVVGNLGLLSLITVSPKLHTPMYYFLKNLSFLDFCYSSVTVPKMLMGFSECQSISFSGCLVQNALFVVFVVTEFFLLASMAYDRYVAVCNPLLYHTTMSSRLCLQLVAASYAVGLLEMVFLTSTIFHLIFCKSHIIAHYFCDIQPLLKLSCSDTQIVQFILYACSSFNVSVSLTVILVSYTYVFLAIFRIPSSKGKHKTFSTCASHLTAVSLYYGTTVFVYMRPSTEYTLGKDSLVSVFYTVVIPMLNPVIYSLRNKDVKETFGNIFKRTSQFSILIPRFS